MYPKDYYRSHELVTEPGSCFVAMPFQRAFDPVFHGIKRALETGDPQFTVLRTDKDLGGQNIIDAILRGIGSSEIFIADVTDRNPNVFYELGLAHIVKDVDKVILITQSIEAIPFDLRPYSHIQYARTAAGIRKLKNDIRKAVTAVAYQTNLIKVDHTGNGRLPGKLFAPDRCLYDVEVPECYPAANSGKFRLRVTRHAIGERPRILFQSGFGLAEGETRRVPETPLQVTLERVVEGWPWLRVDLARRIAARSTSR